MSKAKELATNVISQMEEIQRQVMNNNSLSGFTNDWQSGFNHAMIELRNRLNEAVLSEPEPVLKGWIEVTFLQKEDLENVSGKGFIDVKTIQMCSFDPINQKSGITFHHAPDTCFHVQESYDSIKQKIKGAS